MASALEKSFSILDILTQNPDGLQVSVIAQLLDQPLSGVHRQLRELARMGYVNQLRQNGEYALTLKLAALGLGFLARTGVTDIAQPILDRLAAQSEELVRLSVLSGKVLTWIAVSQGATSGLRYDPGQEQGVQVHPASTAAGIAWLSTMNEAEILETIARTGLNRQQSGKTTGVPQNFSGLMAKIEQTRANGFSLACNSYLEGMTAIAAPIWAMRDGQKKMLGCVSIAGPAVRMDEDAVSRFHPMLTEAAEELGTNALASRFFASIPAKGDD